MKYALSLTGGLALLGTTALAGGLDRSGNDYAILFEDGNYAKLSLSSAHPEISGAYPAQLGGGVTGNMQENYQTLSGSIKYGVMEGLDATLFLNEPYGASSNYTQGAYGGLQGEWKSNQISVVLSYEAMSDITVFGGVRSVNSEAKLAIPDAVLRGGLLKGAQAQLAAANAAGNTAAATALTTQIAGIQGAPAGAFNYSATSDSDRATGYVLGAAYERPDIALRVGLTYESKIDHEFSVTEAIPARADLSGTTSTTVEMPQSIALDFQSGVAADTLVFGSVRWADWDRWAIKPDGYATLTGGQEVTRINSDVITYRIGVGRKFTESISGFARLTHEAKDGEALNRLAPTDGVTSLGLGGSYSVNNMKVTGGIEYASLGGGTDSSGVVFEDNKAIGVGLSVGFSF